VRTIEIAHLLDRSGSLRYIYTITVPCGTRFPHIIIP
jgi:hypothetical protein